VTYSTVVILLPMQAQPHDLVDYVNAFSTAAVALFALVAWWQAGDEKRRRARVARARLVARADGLGRLLRQWTDVHSREVIGMSAADLSTTSTEGERRSAWLYRFNAQGEMGERLMTELIADALDAPRPVANAVHAAAAPFWNALSLLRSMQDRPPGSFAEMMVVFEREGWKNLQASKGLIDEVSQLARKPSLSWRRPLARILSAPYRRIRAKEIAAKLKARE
jgi:hypothetical protein